MNIKGSKKKNQVLSVNIFEQQEIIANLVKDGNFGMPYLPEKLYADIRVFRCFEIS